MTFSTHIATYTDQKQIAPIYDYLRFSGKWKNDGILCLDIRSVDHVRESGISHIFQINFFRWGKERYTLGDYEWKRIMKQVTEIKKDNIDGTLVLTLEKEKKTIARLFEYYNDQIPSFFSLDSGMKVEIYKRHQYARLTRLKFIPYNHFPCVIDTLNSEYQKALKFEPSTHILEKLYDIELRGGHGNKLLFSISKEYEVRTIYEIVVLSKTHAHNYTTPSFKELCDYNIEEGDASVKITLYFNNYEKKTIDYVDKDEFEKAMNPSRPLKDYHKLALKNDFVIGIDSNVENIEHFVRWRINKETLCYSFYQKNGERKVISIRQHDENKEFNSPTSLAKIREEKMEEFLKEEKEEETFGKLIKKLESLEEVTTLGSVLDKSEKKLEEALIRLENSAVLKKKKKPLKQFLSTKILLWKMQYASPDKYETLSLKLLNMLELPEEDEYEQNRQDTEPAIIEAQQKLHSGGDVQDLL